MHLALASSQLPGAVRLCPRRPHVAPCVRPSALPSRRHHLTTLASSSRQQPPAAPATSPGNGWRTFWSTIDAGAWLGTVGTAVAFLLTQEALLVTGPVLLPLIALYASRQRGKLDAQAAQAEVQRQVTAALRQFASMSEESAIAIADEVAAAVDEVWQGLPAPEEALKKVEGKLKGLEGSVRSVEAAVASAKEDAAEQAGRTVREVSAALGALRRDLGGDLRKATGDELSALAGLDTRLAVSCMHRRAFYMYQGIDSFHPTLNIITQV